jgi:hypothetical protein
MLKTYSGSCHCGAVRFEADIDLEKGTGRCNCSICTKPAIGARSSSPMPSACSPARKRLCDYQFGAETAHHPFCRFCGVRPFGTGHVEQVGGDYVTIRLSALDDADPAELAAGPIRYFNGRDNNWWSEPAETRHL